MEYLKSPLNYSGTKQNCLDFLYSNFPKDKSILFDLFTGDGCVSINAPANFKKIYLNDILYDLYNFYEAISVYDSWAWEEFKKEILKYQIDSQSQYIKLRSDFNNLDETDPGDAYKMPYMFFVLASNDNTLEKLKGYFNVLNNNDTYIISCEDFRNTIKSIVYNVKNGDEETKDIFVYLDPPYIQTSAAYNIAWTQKDDDDLYNAVVSLDEAGIKFAISNTLYHKGEINPSYEQFKRFNLIEVPEFYNKDKDLKSVEILIKNY